MGPQRAEEVNLKVHLDRPMNETLELPTDIRLPINLHDRISKSKKFPVTASGFAMVPVPT